MPKIAYSDQIHDLGRLSEAVDLHRAELPTTGPRADHYRAQVERVRELKALQQSCLAGYRTATRELEAAIREARDGAISLRAALTADFGPADARLVEFGIRLRRRRRSATRAGRDAVAAEISVGDAGGEVSEVASRVTEPPRGSGAPEISATATEKAVAPLSREMAGFPWGRDARGHETVEGQRAPAALQRAAAEVQSGDTAASGGRDAPQEDLDEAIRGARRPLCGRDGGHEGGVCAVEGAASPRVCSLSGAGDPGASGDYAVTPQTARRRVFADLAVGRAEDARAVRAPGRLIAGAIVLDTVTDNVGPDRAAMPRRARATDDGAVAAGVVDSARVLGFAPRNDLGLGKDRVGLKDRRPESGQIDRGKGELLAHRNGRKDQHDRQE